MGYITIDQLKSTLELTGETFADADVTLAINAASDLIDAQCHRRFTLDVDNTNQRLYRLLVRHLVDIDDVVDVQTVEVSCGDGTFTTLTVDTDYTLEPLNAPADSEPWTTIRLYRHHGHHHHHRIVRVTGQFGWPQVPNVVAGATGILAGRLLKRARETPFGIVQIGFEGQAARISQSDPDICALLTPVTKNLVR